tara:strand:+ start:561 stop:1361 length:801 start_codon:yes stop_codon:yes gene_type:complete
MTELLNLTGTKEFAKSLVDLVEWWKTKPNSSAQTIDDRTVDTDYHPPIRYITLQTYSTYILRTYASTSYDLDGDDRAGQKYLVMVDGDKPIRVALTHYEAAGNQKQMIEFAGDSINGEIKLIFDGFETDPISLTAVNVTSENITKALEKLPNIEKNNVSVSVFPGRWIVEFIGKLAGKSFDLFEVDRPEDAVFEVLVSETMWADSRKEADLHYPIPLYGKYDSDDGAINDAVAAGSIGTGQWFPGIGYVSDLNECRDSNGDGTPDL